MRRTLCVLVVAGLAGWAIAADRPKADNTNAVLKEFNGKLAFAASSYWGGWPPSLAFDGNKEKSWFTAKGDTVTQKTKPWVSVTFPQDVTVKRVTVHGNREHPWEKGYAFLAGRVELFDADGQILQSAENDGLGEHKDFDFVFLATQKVRSVRFTALGDEGDKNQYEDVAVGEIEIE